MHFLLKVVAFFGGEAGGVAEEPAAALKPGSLVGCASCNLQRLEREPGLPNAVVCPSS